MVMQVKLRNGVEVEFDEKEPTNLFESIISEVLIPKYKDNLNWAIYPAIWHLDGVAKMINLDKPDIKTPVENLYLVGDCVKSPGIGFNCALNSARILADNLLDFN